MKKYISGIFLAAAVTVNAYLIADVPLIKQFSLSPIILAILIGMLIKNTLGVRRPMREGVKFCSKKVLRLAIILLGFKLNLADVGELGLQATLLILFVSTATMLFTYYIGKKIGVAKGLALLIGAGSSVCGASAVIAVDAVSPHTKEEDVAFAIGVVTIFGTLFMLLYPIMFKLFNMSYAFYGMWAGLSIHEVAQVVAAGFAVSEEAGLSATIVKLTRVLFIIPVTLWLSFAAVRATAGAKFDIKKISVPWFVLMFLGVIIFNSFNILGKQAADIMIQADNYLMTAAMAALGLETSFSAMRKVGMKPVWLGVISSVFISLLSAGLIVLLGRLFA